jgi:hypothetical protein
VNSILEKLRVLHVPLLSTLIVGGLWMTAQSYTAHEQSTRQRELFSEPVDPPTVSAAMDVPPIELHTFPVESLDIARLIRHFSPTETMTEVEDRI